MVLLKRQQIQKSTGLRLCSLLFISIWLCLTGSAQAVEQVYLAPEQFVENSFEDGDYDVRSLWLTGDVGESAQEILGHKPDSIRVRYWRSDSRTAWILEEVGKEHPITMGFVVEGGRIVNFEVLIYRESRGWEVRYPFFRDQLKGAGLSTSEQLDQSVDNISGATLSVNAVERTAHLALYYHSVVVEP